MFVHLSFILGHILCLSQPSTDFNNIFYDILEPFIQEKYSKSIPQLLKQAKKVCHAYIKARDRQGNYTVCISCQKPVLTDLMQAGHFHKSELYSCVRFNENNIHLQCENCNCFEEGNLSMYEPNLINKIGIEAFTELQDTVEAYKRSLFKWDRVDLVEIIDNYTLKLQQLA